MQLFRKHTGEPGAVTVFLVIILVPCIVVACVFVDISRVMYAQNLSGSSADLALNTAMTNYDSELKKLYGLMASAQDMDDVYEKAGQYYCELLESKGLSQEEALAMGATMTASLQNGNSPSDLLDAHVQGENKNIVTPAYDNATLANATLLKNQIVDFMKYRAPIDIATGAFELLRQFKDSGQEIKDSENDEKIIKKKESYFEAEADLIEALEKIYKEMKSYQDNYVEGFETLKQEILSTEGKYGELHSMFIKNALDKADIDFPGREDFASEKESANIKIKDINAYVIKHFNDTKAKHDALDSIKSSLNSLEGLAATCKQKSQEWQNQINERPDTELARQDQEEMDSLVNELLGKIDSGAQSLKTRNDELVARLAYIMEEIDGYDSDAEAWNMAYNVLHKNEQGAWTQPHDPKKVKNIKSLNDYSWAQVWSRWWEDMSEADFVRYTRADSKTFYFKGADLSHIGKKDTSFESEELYQWMRDFFSSVDEQVSGDTKDAKDQMQDRREAEKEKGSGEPDESGLGESIGHIADYGSFPSQAAGQTGSADVLGGFLGLADNFIQNGLEGGLLNMRDALYTTEYARGMFSFYTLESEGAKREERLGTNEPTDTLTMASLDQFNTRSIDNNYAYRMELEYILYGHEEGVANVASAAGNIFAIRMMLNTPSAFLNFYVTAEDYTNKPTGSTILTMARAASLATRLPRQLFQAVFILAIAAIESGLDIKDLMEGSAVKLYKQKEEDWKCRLPSADNFDVRDWEKQLEGEKQTNIKDKELYLFYSDYLYLFLLMGYNAPATAEAMYLRTADVIQANMRKTTGYTAFQMQKATVFLR
jgi:hypothetical protein